MFLGAVLSRFDRFSSIRAQRQRGLRAPPANQHKLTFSIEAVYVKRRRGAKCFHRILRDQNVSQIFPTVSQNTA